MQSSLFLLTVMGQCFLVTCHHIEYHLIEEAKTWDEAQRYCKENYTDLATVSDMTDMKRLREIVNTQEAWIGLQSNPGKANRRWHWSLPGTQGVALSDLKTYFHNKEPNDHNNKPENCVLIRNKRLNDATCDKNNKFICFNGTEEPPKSFIYIKELMNWTQAQNYCRDKYTDLVSGLDQLAHLADNTESWIGLFRDTWSWSDGSISSFRHWNLGLLKDGVNKECATVGEEKWDSAACDEKKPFVCYKGQCVSFTCHHIEYHLIEEAKTWDEAQRYCKEKYTDLATVSDMTDMKRLREIVNTQEAWIGLQNNPGQANRRWHWSLPGTQGVALSELKTYFPGHEPHSGNSDENCARNVGGELLDTLCGINKTFICFNGTEESPKSFIYIKELMNWTQAQNYCRDKYTDLVSGLDQLAHLADNTDRWIGLFRDTWSWSDGSNSSFRHWNLGLLKDGVNKECATVLKGEGKWDSAACDEKKPFVCYKDKVILINEVMTWEEAVNYCRENHRDLVSITDLNQQRWVEARAKDASTDHVWLGLRYTCLMDLWFWLNDNLVTYENWAHSDGECDRCYYAAAMNKSGKWVKKADTEKFNFICALK